VQLEWPSKATPGRTKALPSKAAGKIQITKAMISGNGKGRMRHVLLLMLVGEGAVVQFAGVRDVQVVDVPDPKKMVVPRAMEKCRV
jgi:hypothetical protein